MALQPYYSLVEVKLVNWHVDTKKTSKMQHRKTDDIWEERWRDMEERADLTYSYLEVREDRQETRVKTIFKEGMDETMLKDIMLF